MVIKCVVPECHFVARFGLPGGVETHCRCHMLEGQVRIGKTSESVDVSRGNVEPADKYQTCVVCCKKRPSHGVAGGKATHCGMHQLSDHIGVARPVCV